MLGQKNISVAMKTTEKLRMDYFPVRIPELA